MYYNFQGLVIWGQLSLKSQLSSNNPAIYHFFTYSEKATKIGEMSLSYKKKAVILSNCFGLLQKPNFGAFHVL